MAKRGEQAETAETARMQAGVRAWLPRTGEILAIAGDDGTPRLWDVAIPRHLLGAVCAIGGRALTQAQWHAYAPTELYRPVCT